MSALNLTVERIDASADALITNLFDLYLHDMAEWFLFDIGDEGRFRYDMSKHWARGDEVYIARCDGKLAGFALVTLAKNIVPDAEGYDVEEFFVVRRYRHTGGGRGARESDLGHASGTMARARLRGQSPSDSVLAQDHLALHERSADRRAPHLQQQGVVVLPLQEQRFVTSTRYRWRAPATLMSWPIRLSNRIACCSSAPATSFAASPPSTRCAACWAQRSDIVVASAGTEDFPHVVRPVVRDYLLQHGLDVRAHRRRTLTAQILADATDVIAMSTDHRATLRDHFGCADAPLFTTACGLADEPLPDVDEAIVDYATNPDAVAAHVRLTIDRIIELTPRLAARLLQR